MIPFLKKNKDGKKLPKSTVPRTAQESIPFQRMFEDGTCRVRPGYYTRTIQYQDINYQLAQQEDKTAIFEEWCSFLNFFDSSIKFELSFVNTATDSADFEKSIRIPYQKDGFDDVRAEYSQMLRQQLSKGNNGLTKTKFLTYGIEGESMAQVKPRLEHIQNDLMNNFHRLGVLAKPLDGTERLRLMHGIQREQELMLIVLSLSCQRKALRCDGLRKSPWCDKPQRRLYGGQRLSGQLVRWASRGACTAECLWWAVCQVEHCRLAHPAAKVAVSGVCVHQKAIWCPAKADAPPGCG